MKRFLNSAGEPRLVGPVVDCHQHEWPESFLEALRSRGSEPRLDGWRLTLAGEPPYDVNPTDHDPTARAALDHGDGVDLTLLSLSSPLGIETMRPEESEPLLAAWHGYADDLLDQDARAIWAATNLLEPDLGGLAKTLRHDKVVGLQVPATSLATPYALETLAPVLAEVQAAAKPVLVHPGPAAPVDRHASHRDLPGWWPALTDYPAQQQAAWFAWHVAGRALLPTLRIGYVALAGLAPLHHERLAQRGGNLGSLDRGVFYETSSYGLRAVDAMTRVVGVDPIVHGSDRPYAQPTDPGLGEAFSHALFVANPHRFLYGEGSAVPTHMHTPPPNGGTS